LYIKIISSFTTTELQFSQLGKIKSKRFKKSNANKHGSLFIKVKQKCNLLFPLASAHTQFDGNFVYLFASYFPLILNSNVPPVLLWCVLAHLAQKSHRMQH